MAIHQMFLNEAQYFINWLNTALFLDNQAYTTHAHKRSVRRGEVYWCHLGYNIGTEIRKTTPRPCVIIQNDKVNIRSSNTIVCPITHSSRNYSCLIPIGIYKNQQGNIILDGKANISNILTIDKVRLDKKILPNPLPKSVMDQIDNQLLFQTGLISKFQYLNTKCQNQDLKIKRMFNRQTDLILQLNCVFKYFNVNNFEELKKKISKTP